MSTVPIFLIGVVFGLAMDYEVFLVSRKREAFVQGHTRMRRSRPECVRVPGSSSLPRIVMIGVFAGFVAEQDAFIKMLGFALAAAVLFDAFVVRLAIVPAVMALLGHHAWWLPRRLDKILPAVDVEGAGLARPSNGRLDHGAKPETPVTTP